MMVGFQSIEAMVNKVVSVSGRGRAIAQAVSRTERIKFMATESAKNALGYRYRVSSWYNGQEYVCTFSRLLRAQRSFGLCCARRCEFVSLVDTETGEVLDEFRNEK